MRAVGVIARIIFVVLLLAEAGCGPTRTEFRPSADIRFNLLSAYAPVKIDIMPLTKFVGVGEDEETSTINVYVSLLDSFGCQGKSPGVFRFELYDHVERSADKKGRRIIIWQDIDLTNVVENNNYWRDFLRAYEFNLDFEPQNNRSYVLQVTCLCPSGKRLLDEIVIKYAK
jgi:hypothetical protein